MKHNKLCAAALALAGLALVVLVGCSLPSLPGASDAPAAALDPLTGQAAIWTDQCPAAVTVQSDAGANLRGIGDASLVLEALTEGETSSSLCLVWPSVEAVPEVGPVAAGQDLYWQLLAAQQVLPVQRGAGVYAGNLLDEYGVRTVDALEVGVSAFYYEGAWGQPDALSWYTSGSRLSSVLAGLEIDPQTQSEALDTEPAPLPALLPFGEVSEPGTQGVAGIEVQFSETAVTGFTYDAEVGVYRMTDAGGAPRIDANTGEQAAFDNVLVLYSAPTLRDDGHTWGYDLTMGGGYYLSGGQAWNILWTQGVDTTLSIYNSGGKAISIQPGRSYIALLGSLPGQQLILTDASGAKLSTP